VTTLAKIGTEAVTRRAASGQPRAGAMPRAPYGSRHSGADSVADVLGLIALLTRPPPTHVGVVVSGGRPELQ
jgi:hypothetical protein